MKCICCKFGESNWIIRGEPCEDEVAKSWVNYLNTNYPVSHWLEDVPMSELHVVNLTTMKDSIVKLIFSEYSQTTVFLMNRYYNNFYYSVPIYEAI